MAGLGIAEVPAGLGSGTYPVAVRTMEVGCRICLPF